MVERNVMKSDDSDIDSLDVFNQQHDEDFFPDSLEPTTFKEKCVNGVC